MSDLLPIYTHAQWMDTKQMTTRKIVMVKKKVFSTVLNAYYLYAKDITGTEIKTFPI